MTRNYRTKEFIRLIPILLADCCCFFSLLGPLWVLGQHCRSCSCVVSRHVFMKLFYEQIKWWWWCYMYLLICILTFVCYVISVCTTAFCLLFNKGISWWWWWQRWCNITFFLLLLSRKAYINTAYWAWIRIYSIFVMDIMRQILDTAIRFPGYAQTKED